MTATAPLVDFEEIIGEANEPSSDEPELKEPKYKCSQCSTKINPEMIFDIGDIETDDHELIEMVRACCENCGFEEERKKKFPKEKPTPEMLKAWNSYKPPKGVATHGCFGYVAGSLIVGDKHHQAIMALLIDNGWTWDQLMEAEQIWGWYSLYYGHQDKKPYVDLNYVSDGGFLHKEASKGCKEAFAELFGLTDIGGKAKGKFKNNGGDVLDRGHGKFGGDFERHYGEGKLLPSAYVRTSVTPIPPPPEPKEEIESG